MADNFELTPSANDARSDNLTADDIMEPGMTAELLRELRTEQRSLDATGKKAARRAMIRAYKIAEIARVNRDVWLSICNDPVWSEMGFKQRPRSDNQDNALRYVVRLSVGFGEDATSTASKRYVAMKPAMERGDAASDIAELLDKHGGAEELAKWEKGRLAEKHSTPKAEVLTIKLTGENIGIFKWTNLRDFDIKIYRERTSGNVVWATAKKVHAKLPCLPKRSK